MPDYVKDPNNSKKQIPGSNPDNYYDRVKKPQGCTLQKTPNYVYINKTIAGDGVGFFFGSSASFSEKSTAQHCGVIGNLPLSASSNYENFGLVPVGTKLDIHPTAFSASQADSGSVTFVYKGGLDGSGRPG